MFVHVVRDKGGGGIERSALASDADFGIAQRNKLTIDFHRYGVVRVDAEIAAMPPPHPVHWIIPNQSKQSFHGSRTYGSFGIAVAFAKPPDIDRLIVPIWPVAISSPVGEVSHGADPTDTVPDRRLYG